MKWRGRAGVRTSKIAAACPGAAWPSGGGLGGLVLVLLISALTGQNPADLIDSVGPAPRRRARRRSGRRSSGPVRVRRARATPRRRGDDCSRERQTTSRRRWCCSPAQRSRRAVWARRRWDRSIALPIARCISTVLLPGARRTIRRAGRLRAGLRRGARDRSSRPDTDRRVARGAGGQATRRRARSQRALGAAGAAGRLLRRRVGTLRRATGCSSPVTPKRASSGRRDRRRSAAAADARNRGPESFTHGSSEQRVEWLRRGLESGSVDSCNTFNSARSRSATAERSEAA